MFEGIKRSLQEAEEVRRAERERRRDDPEQEYDDFDVSRNHASRLLVSAGIVILLALVLPIITTLVIWLVTHNWWLIRNLGGSWYFGLFIVLCGVGVTAVGRVFPKITAYVPQAQGLVTQNPWVSADNQIVYGGGLHARFPWEEVEEKSHQTLESITLEHAEDYDAQGTTMRTKWSFTVQPDLCRLHRFVFADPDTIDRTFRDQISQFLSSELAVMSPVDARQALTYLTLKLGKAFGIPTPDMARDQKVRRLEQEYGELAEAEDSLSDERGALEARFGVRFATFQMADIDFPEEVRKAMAASAEAIGIMKTVAMLAGEDPADVEDDSKRVNLMKRLQERPDYMRLVDRAMATSGNAGQFNLGGDLGSVAEALLSAVRGGAK